MARRTKGHDLPPGIRRRHDRDCPAARTDDLEACRCRPAYQAQAGPRSARKTKTFPTRAAAVSWKRDVDRAVERGELTGGRAPTVREAAEAWLSAAEKGIVLARGDKPYKPSTLRGYRRCMESELYPELGGTRLHELTRGHLNRYVQTLQARGLAAQTVKNVVMPLRALYRYAVDDMEWLAANPTKGIRVPAGAGKRMRFLAPAQIPTVLEALDVEDRPLWATAIYAGLRRGELMALRWTDVDLAGGVITVAWNYDPGAKQMVAVKSESGQDRQVPIAGVLRDYLLEHRQRAGGRPRGLVFKRSSLAHRRLLDGDRDLPFADQAVGERAARRWAKVRGVPVVTLHDCRHTYASLLIAASVRAGRFNPKAIQEALGHASIQQTYDRYGHLFPGTHAELGRMLDTFLEVELDPRPQVTQHAHEGVSSELDDLALPSVTPSPDAGCERPASIQHGEIRRVR